MRVARALMLVGMAVGVLRGASCRADTLQYSYVETGGPETITFQLQSPPTTGLGFGAAYETATIPITVDGTTRDGFLDIYTSAYNGGFVMDAGITEGQLSGPQLFMGSTTMPVFLTGTFDLSGYLITVGHGAVPRTQSGVLTVTEVTPEPPSLVLLGTALMGVAGLVHMRRRVGAA